MADTGWIKLHKDVDELDLMKKGEPYDKTHAYIDLLIQCNYEDKIFSPCGGRFTFPIHRGEFHTSIENLAKRWNWGTKKVRFFLELLEKKGLIILKTSSFGQTLTLTRYDAKPIQGQTEGITEGKAEGKTEGKTEGIAEGTTEGIRLKKDKKYKNSKENQEPKNTAKRSGFVWGEDE